MSEPNSGICEAALHVAVTGASGFVGRWLVDEAIQAGCSVMPVAGPSRLDDGADLSDAAIVKHLFSSTHINALIHCAAITDIVQCETYPSLALQANVLTTVNVARACREHSVLLVLLSSDYVFPGTKEEYRENDDCAPLQIYGLTKYLSERVADWTGDFLTVRLPLLYDLGQDNRGFVARAAQEVAERGVVQIDSRLRRFPTYVRDAARTVVRLLLAGARGIYHVSAGQELTKFELLQLLAPSLAVESKRIIPIADQHYSQLRPHRVRLECRRLREMGWEVPPPPSEVTADFVGGRHLNASDGSTESDDHLWT